MKPLDERDFRGAAESHVELVKLLRKRELQKSYELMDKHIFSFSTPFWNYDENNKAAHRRTPKAVSLEKDLLSFFKFGRERIVKNIQKNVFLMKKPPL